MARARAAMAEADTRVEHFAGDIKNQQLKKQLTIIDHITAGRASEAIQELLDPIICSLSFEVVYADDNTRLAAEEELLQRIIKNVTNHLLQIKIKREEKPE